MSRKKRYLNIDDVKNENTFHTFSKWRKERRLKLKDLSFVVPQTDVVELPFLHSNKEMFSVTWIGHATFLIQIDGLNIVTDPVWANKMGFDQRLSPPGIALADVPDIDVVLISHSHYDHLHFRSLKKLKGNPLFLVPDGLESLMKKRGFYPCENISWWDSYSIGNVKFTFVPAQHWSRRTVRDMNCSHWGGWIIENEAMTTYFAGDSGYFRGFKEIGSRFQIDIALIPIGAYEPEWFMEMQHVTPEQAVQAFIDTNAKIFIPMHYGAFRLADDTPKEALDRLQAEWTRMDLNTDQLKILKLGETLKKE